MRWTLCLLLLASAPAADAVEPSARGPGLGETTTSTWRFGVIVQAPGGLRGGVATMAIPQDWPEQSVQTIDQRKSARVGSVTFRQLDRGVKQMVVTIPRLAAGEEASATVTIAIARRALEAPEETAVYRVPDKLPADLRKYLLPSPYIESADPKIKALAAELTAGKNSGWESAAAIYDYVRAHVKYEFAEQIKPAIAALEDGQGDCEELSSLVIALCRASKIPARAVWVPEHTYPEFYLLDERGQGHWFPCQAAGAERQFGGMWEERPILQKGDNFKMPEERTAQRYVKQTFTAKDAAAPPTVKFLLERVAE